MALNEASLLCPENVAEDLADALMDAGVMSVSTEDADADSPDEVPLYGEPGLEPTTQAWRNSRLKLLVDESFDIGKAMRDASESLGIEPPRWNPLRRFRTPTGCASRRRSSGPRR